MTQPSNKEPTKRQRPKPPPGPPDWSSGGDQLPPEITDEWLDKVEQETKQQQAQNKKKKPEKKKNH